MDLEKFEILFLSIVLSIIISAIVQKVVKVFIGEEDYTKINIKKIDDIFNNIYICIYHFYF